MDKLGLQLHALSMEDASDKVNPPGKDLASCLGSSTASRPSLETLPVELQLLILSQTSALSTLSALVHASPRLHRVYVDDRPLILRSVLRNALNGTLLDAVGAYYSGTDFFQRARNESFLWDFVEEYESEYTTTATDWPAALSLDEIIQILHFHTSIIEPLTDRYASWALASLPVPSTTEQPRKQPIRFTERCRIQRAMYRLQVFCNVCGSIGEGRSSPNRIEGNIDRLRVLSIFSAWEIEEILCIHRFAEAIYTEVFRKVAWDLNEDKNPKYKHLDMTETNEDLLLVSNHEGNYGRRRCNINEDLLLGWNDEDEDGCKHSIETWLGILTNETIRCKRAVPERGSSPRPPAPVRHFEHERS